MPYMWMVVDDNGNTYIVYAYRWERSGNSVVFYYDGNHVA